MLGTGKNGSIYGFEGVKTVYLPVGVVSRRSRAWSSEVDSWIRTRAGQKRSKLHERGKNNLKVCISLVLHTFI